MFYYSLLLPPAWPIKDIKLLVKRLEETVNEFPEISAFVFYLENYYTRDKETFKIVGENYIAIKEIDSKLSRSRDKVIILNDKFTNCSLSPAEVKILETI